MKISCVQMDMRLGDVEYNFAHAQDLVRLAVDRDGPDVVVLPETWNTGFFPKDLNPCADRGGERTKLDFSSLARGLDIQLRRRAAEGMEIAAIFFSNRFGILGRTPGAEKLAARHPAAEA